MPGGRRGDLLAALRLIGLQARPFPFSLGNHLAHNLVAYDLKMLDIEDAGFFPAAAAIQIHPEVHGAAPARSHKTR